MQFSSQTYKILCNLSHQLSQGFSVQQALKSNQSVYFGELWIALQSLVGSQNLDDRVRSLKQRFRHPHQQLLIELVQLGLIGHPIFEKIKELEKSIYVKDINVLDEHHKKLPYKIMLPVFLLIVPGYLTLMFGFLFKYVQIKGF